MSQTRYKPSQMCNRLSGCCWLRFIEQLALKSGDDRIIGESSVDDSLFLKDSTSVSSRASALLLGNLGSTMKCKFQFSNPDVGIDGGGIDQCHTSKEQTVSVTF